jgi:D-3-phosphoglycerate dehydrogenase / 2-oxoglutarate reductase
VGRPLPLLLFDVDSTLLSVEALDKLFELHGEDPTAFAELTHAGMEGQIPAAESLSKRLALFPDGGPGPRHLRALQDRVLDWISPSVRRHLEFFRTHSQGIFLISGGFHEWIDPLARELGVPPSNVQAHRFRAGAPLSLDPSTPMARGGKVGAARTWVEAGRFPAETPRWIVGDGATDLELRTAGIADRFVAWTETVTRPTVVVQADHEVLGMDDLLELIHAERDPAPPHPPSPPSRGPA